MSEDSRESAGTRPNAAFMSVREVAEYLHLNTKKVYALVREGRIPATKVTGKWLFPRKLVDQWLMESSHGGLLTDRLIITGGDDPLLQRAVSKLVEMLQGHAVIGHSVAGTQLGLELLARHRVDACAVRWGPASESQRRHTALLAQHPPHKSWVLVRAFSQERGLLLGRAVDYAGDLAALFQAGVRWALFPGHSSADRQLHELCARHDFDPARLRVVHTVASEHEAASKLARQQADVAPGSRAIAELFGLGFVSLDWEACDFALERGVYFRTLFQRFLETLNGEDCRMYAQTLGGYDFTHCGRIIWSD